MDNLIFVTIICIGAHTCNILHGEGTQSGSKFPYADGDEPEDDDSVCVCVCVCVSCT